MAEQSITLNPGESRVVSFEVTPQEARIYQVSVNGLTGSFKALSTNLSGLITDRLDNSKIVGAKVALGSLITYTDINGLYAFYGLATGSYSGLVEKDHYHPLAFTAQIVSGENRLGLSIDPILLTSVVVGIRTKASEPDITTPDISYKSRPLFWVGTFEAGTAYLLGDDYINNTSFYTDYTVIVPLNPHTNQAWRETDLEKYLFGVWLWAAPSATGETRCTQLSVVANYPDGSTKILRPYAGYGWEKVDDVVPDEDASYVSYTTSGAPIPFGGGYFKFKVR